MSSHFKGHLGRVLATIAVLCAFGTLAMAQYQPAPKWELYGGYSFWYPGADVHGVLPLGIVPITSRLDSNPRGAGASVTYDFTRHFGITLDASDHWGISERGTPGACCRDADLSNLSIGPKVTFRGARFSPFLEALGGDLRLYPEDFHHIDKLGLMAGGGLDINLTKHIAFRLIRADYVMSSYRYGPSSSTPTTVLAGVRLQSGIVFMFGGGQSSVTPPMAACSIQPMELFAGEPVTATASGTNFNPKRTLKYEWSGTGVKVSGSNPSVQIDTTGLQPGSYQVAAKLSDGSSKGMASCNASFTVRATHPPVISCSPDPASVPMGGSSTITSIGSSPDNRILTYSYATSAGSITGNTSTAKLDSTGAQPGTITVTCTVTDDRNPPLTASFIAAVNVQAAPQPPTQTPAVEVQAPTPAMIAIEKRLALHSVYFGTAKPTSENPDGGLLASQEQTLTTLATDFKTYLQSKPDARLTLEGHADPRGSAEYNQALSERRVQRTKRFLIEKGVPAESIQTEAYGKLEDLTDAQVRSAVERNPELSTEERQRLLDHIHTIFLASNRRVDITLSNAGQKSQESVREYPFNAADSLTLLDTRETNKPSHPATKKTRTTKKH
jgi:outer membrane protein OmpA-like peptidoglycan-associated protein